MDKILKAVIIGANSYIARNMIAVLQNHKNIEITALYDYQESFIDALIYFNGLMKYSKINILDTKTIYKLNLDVDLIFFFSGKTGTSSGFEDYEVFIDVNEKGLLNLLTEYRYQKSKAKIIFPSTRLIYKGAQEKLSEDAEKEFKTVYAVNKFACEEYLKMYKNVYGVRYCIFRICVPYGTLVSGASSYGTAEFMINRANQGENIILFGDGSTRRTLTYIEDLCESIIHGSLSPQGENDVFNIGGEDYCLKEMATLIAEKYGVSVDYTQWDDMALKIESGDTVFNSDKLDNIIEYERNMTFERWITEYFR